MQLFFLTGLPKTGSTWLMNLLNEIPPLQCLGEGRFFASGLRHVPSLYDATYAGIYQWGNYISERKHNWLDDGSSITTIQRYNYISEKQKENIAHELTRTTLRETISELMSKRAKATTHAMGDKTPTLHIETLDRIQQTFPNARTILLQRGLYDFLASFIQHFHRATRDRRPDAAFDIFSIEDFLCIEAYLNGQSELVVSTPCLEHLIATWCRFQKRINEGSTEQCLCVNYEELRADPVNKLADIVHFIDPKLKISGLDQIVNAWEFDSENIKMPVNRAHVAARDIGYGHEFFNAATLKLIQHFHVIHSS